MQIQPINRKAVAILSLGICFFFPKLAQAQTSLGASLKVKICHMESDKCKKMPAASFASFKCVPFEGAKITILNVNTGVQRDGDTNADGEYTFLNLSDGKYGIKAGCSGCSFYVYPKKEPYTIRVNDPKTIKPPPAICLTRGGASDGDGGQFSVSSRAIMWEANSSGPNDSSMSGNAATSQIPPARQTTSNDAPLVAGLVRVANAERGGNIDQSLLEAAPLLGIRTIDSLIFLFPGVAPHPQTLSNTPGPGIGAGVGTSGQFSVNGLRSRANNFTIDGSDNNDEDIGVRRQGFTTLLPQSVESVQGLNVITLLPTPQFGRNLGAQVNLVSRNGKPRYHGTVYGFFTNDRLKARDFFDLMDGPSTFPIIRASDKANVIFDGNALNPPNPVGGENPYFRGQGGFVFGGPIGKQEKAQNFADFDSGAVRSKLLCFSSFERQAINSRKESHFAVPDIAARGLFGSGERGLDRRLFNPQDQGPLYPASVTGNAAFSFYPFPNNPRGPYGMNTYTQILPAEARGALFSVRVDQTLNPSKQTGNARGGQTLTGRYNFTDDDTILPVTGGALFSSLRALVRTQNFSFFHNFSFSENATNEFRASYGRTNLSFREAPNPVLRSNRFTEEPFLLNARLISNATLPISPVTPDCIQGGIPGQPCFLTQPFETEEDLLLGPIGQILISGYNPVGVDVFNFPQQRVNNTFQYADTLFYHKGRHLITTGFDFRRTQLNSKLDRNFRPLVVFSGAADIATEFGFSRRSPTGYYLGSDFAAVGAPTGFFQTLALTPESTIGLRYLQADFFLSDEVRINKDLTLTLGLRYQRNTVPDEVNRRIERTFNSPEVNKFIEEERKLSGGISGFDKFLGGRTKIFEADNDNFAPHFAFAWSPFDRGTTSIRGGYGIYYDQIPGAVTSQSRNVFPSFLTVNLAGLTTCDRANNACPSASNFFAFNPSRLASKATLNTYDSSRFGNDLVAFLLYLDRFTAPSMPGQSGTFPGGPGFVLPAVDLRTPYSQHWSLTVEHEFRGDFFGSIAYAGARGVHLIRFATPNLGPNVIPVVTGARPNGFDPFFQGFSVPPKKDLQANRFDRPFPLLGSFTSIESDANSTYHSLQAELHKRLSRGLQFTTAYTWSHAIDEVSDLFDLASGPALPQNSFDRRAERASASFDVRHNFSYSLVWDIPALSDSPLLKDWRISSLGAFRTGQPFTLLACCDVNLDGNLSDRLDTDVEIKQVNRGPVQFIAPGDQFSLMARAGTNGLLGRNTFRAPGTAVIDLAVGKTFSFKDNRYKLELRAEFFNLFNRTHFGMPVHQLLFPALGQSVDTRLPARTIQFGGKFNF